MIPLLILAIIAASWAMLWVSPLAMTIAMALVLLSALAILGIVVALVWPGAGGRADGSEAW